MKKRLRKKKRLGEFQELGFRVTGTFTDKMKATILADEHDDFLLQIVCWMEDHQLGCAGGLCPEARHAHELEFYIQKLTVKPRGRKYWTRGTCTEEDRVHVDQYFQELVRQGALKDFKVGTLIDIWHGTDAQWEASS